MKTLIALLLGLALGRAGLEVVSVDTAQRLLPLVWLQVSLALGLLGVRLGQGLLRLPLFEVVRRILPAVLISGITLTAGAYLLPYLMAPIDEPFARFYLPLAFVLTALALLAVRDVRGQIPPDVGPIFLVAIGLLGAVFSFAPALIWTWDLDPSVFWRGPILVLGESGALGVAGGVAYLFTTRALRGPRLLLGTVWFALTLYFAFEWVLWAPFAAVGFGIALGRAGESELPVFLSEWRALRAEWPLVILFGLLFAPDIWRVSLVNATLAYAVGTALLLLLAYRWLPGGHRLVTGPGLIFLGLAVAVRLDPRMGPIGRPVIDLALGMFLAARFTLPALRLAHSERPNEGRG